RADAGADECQLIRWCKFSIEPGRELQTLRESVASHHPACGRTGSEDRHRELPDALQEHLAIRSQHGTDSCDLATDVRNHTLSQLRAELRPFPSADAVDGPHCSD